MQGREEAGGRQERLRREAGKYLCEDDDGGDGGCGLRQEVYADLGEQHDGGEQAEDRGVQVQAVCQCRVDPRLWKVRSHSDNNRSAGRVPPAGE